MNYQKLHDTLVSIGRQRGTRALQGFELHHVIPTCMGGSDDESNKALLTLRAHFILHKILTKLHPMHSGLHHAFWMMSASGKADYKVSSRTYEKAKQNCIDNHHMKTDGARQRFSENNPGKTAKSRLSASKHRKQEAAEGRLNFQIPEARIATSFRRKQENELSASEGRHPSQISSAAGTHHFQSEEHKLGSSNRAKELVQCPHCYKAGQSIGIKRWHFDNCLQHPDNLGLTRQQIKARRNEL